MLQLATFWTGVGSEKSKQTYIDIFGVRFFTFCKLHRRRGVFQFGGEGEVIVSIQVHTFVHMFWS